MRFDIDLEFSAELPPEDGQEAVTVRGSVEASSWVLAGT